MPADESVQYFLHAVELTLPASAGSSSLTLSPLLVVPGEDEKVLMKTNHTPPQR